jgi:DNA repair protein RecO (recombination protein O)
MGYEKVTGIISKETNTGDADRFLTILTFEAGKTECFAKGIRKQKSKLSATAGLFCYGEYQLFGKSNRNTLTSGKLTENFYNIRNDIVRLTYAIHFLEVSRDVILEGQPFPEALKMLLNSLYMLSYTDKNPEIISRVFEMRMMSLSGFSPVLEKCVHCGRVPGVLSPKAREDDQDDRGDKDDHTYFFGRHAYASSDDGSFTGDSDQDSLNYDSLAIYFSPVASGLLCGARDCRRMDKNAQRISEGTLRTLKHIVNCEARDIFNFTISEKVRFELSEIIPKYLRYSMDRDYTKLNYLSGLKL